MNQQLKYPLLLVLVFLISLRFYSTNYFSTHLFENKSSEFMNDSILSELNFSYPAHICNSEKEALPITSNNFRKGGVYTSSSGLWIDKLTGIIQPTQSSPGTYTVLYSISANADTSSGKHLAYVTIQKAQEIFVTPSLIAEPNTLVKLHASGASNFTWSPTKDLSCVTCSLTSIYTTETTEYCAQSKIDGCPVRACTTISVVCNNDKILQIPNAFSPNADGNNDLFCLQGWEMCVSNFHFIIFNRLGQIIFESRDAKQCWDGTLNGHLAEPGVYLYVISASYNRDNAIQKKGNINLLR